MTLLRLASGIALFLGGIMSLTSSTGCSADAGNEGQFPAGGTGSGNGGAGSGATQSAGTDTSMGVFSGGTTTGANGTTSGNTGAGGSCGGVKHTAELKPLAMYIMLDKSGSMDDAAGPITRWEAVTTALQAYINDPSSAGVEVGIQYFGIGLFLSSCNPPDYAMPAVPIAALPGNANALIQSMNGTSPSGLTPTSASLEGGILGAKNYANAHPDRKVVHVYVTDGDPTECNLDFNYIFAAANAGVNNPPSIQTYVIGVGPSLTALQGIAWNGGTGMPFLIDSGPNATQDFINAMNTITGSALSCTFAIPTPTGGMFDPNQVNVEYTPAGMPPQTIGKVDSPAMCPAAPDMAWYYDNNTNPTQIILCPHACSVVSADTTGSIEIVLGCPTQNLPPH